VKNGLPPRAARFYCDGEKITGGSCRIAERPE